MRDFNSVKYACCVHAELVDCVQIVSVTRRKHQIVSVALSEGLGVITPN